MWDDEDEAKEREKLLAKLRRERERQSEKEKEDGDDDGQGPGVEGVESYVSNDPLATVKKYSIGFNGRCVFLPVWIMNHFTSVEDCFPVVVSWVGAVPMFSGLRDCPTDPSLMMGG